MLETHGLDPCNHVHVNVGVCQDLLRKLTRRLVEQELTSLLLHLRILQLESCPLICWKALELAWQLAQELVCAIRWHARRL